MPKDENIDLNNLSQRELLILVHSEVKSLKSNMDKVQENQHKTDLKVNALETKSKVWAGIIGAIFGFIGAIIGSR
jgi:hypothetical protein